MRPGHDQRRPLWRSRARSVAAQPGDAPREASRTAADERLHHNPGRGGQRRHQAGRTASQNLLMRAAATSGAFAERSVVHRNLPHPDYDHGNSVSGYLLLMVKHALGSGMARRYRLDLAVILDSQIRLKAIREHFYTSWCNQPPSGLAHNGSPICG